MIRPEVARTGCSAREWRVPTSGCGGPLASLKVWGLLSRLSTLQVEREQPIHDLTAQIARIHALR